jgi:exonuclease III
MIWAFLWRIGQNNMVPTLFRSDSQLTCDQASGLKGATNLDDSFLCLRGAHQLLETALPRGHLKLEHIYGHCGEPFNDFTDLMAKQEALSSFYLPRLKIDMTSWRTKLPHLWLLFAQHLGGPRLHDGYLHTPVPSLPSTVITSPKIGLQTAQTLTHIKIQLSFCTANVLSMNNRPEGYAGKVGYLAEQFQAHGLLFGGIQEARTPEGSCKCQHILRLCSGASHGHGGVELWINLNQPYGYVGRTPLVLKQENVQVIQADPSRILARVVTTYLDIAIFVGHAPHSGHTQEDRSSWWNRTTDLIHDNCGENKPYVMIDANAEPGPADGCSVMTTDCNTSKSTPLWRQFLDEHHLALPQTLPIHVGGLATWTSIDGTTTHCLDYVAVPLDRLPCCTSSQLLESFDLGNEQQDHTPVAVELEWDFYSISPPPAARQVGSKFDRTVIRTTKMDSFLENFPTIDWSADVDTQILTFNQAVHGELHRLCPVKKNGPKKSFISEEIWMLRVNKLLCRKALKHARKIMTREILATFFQAWHSQKENHHQLSWEPQQQYMTTLLCGTLRCLVSSESMPNSSSMT